MKVGRRREILFAGCVAGNILPVIRGVFRIEFAPVVAPMPFKAIQVVRSKRAADLENKRPLCYACCCRNPGGFAFKQVHNQIYIRIDWLTGLGVPGKLPEFIGSDETRRREAPAEVRRCDFDDLRRQAEGHASRVEVCRCDDTSLWVEHRHDDRPRVYMIPGGSRPLKRQIVFVIPGPVSRLHLSLKLTRYAQPFPIQARRVVAPVFVVVAIGKEARSLSVVAVEVQHIGIFVA